ncbi:class I SAM-dependent methyltransferase [Chloroflexota bacterium]
MSKIGHKPIFTDEYPSFSPFDRYALRALIRKIDKPFKRIAEIGSWTGKGSTAAIIEEIRDGSGVLYCIDHWRGNPDVAAHQSLVSKYDMFSTFRANVSQCGGTEIVRPLVMSSRDAAAITSEHIFDLVFIDGSHSYDETISDIDLWLPKVTVGGILCGHDCEGRSETFEAEYLLTNKNRDGVAGNDVFRHIHPGVILAVHEKFRGRAHLWAEKTIKLENGAVGRSTIWDMFVNDTC